MDDAGPSGAVVVDGLFLHRPELVDAWDLSIWVDARERVSNERISRIVAGAPSSGPLLLVHLVTWWARLVRYVDGLDIREHSPHKAATIVVDNNDLEHLRRVASGSSVRRRGQAPTAGVIKRQAFGNGWTNYAADVSRRDNDPTAAPHPPHAARHGP